MHFMNPVPVMRLIEYVRALTTSDETLATARAFGESLGKRIIVSKDRAGFIVNYLLVPYMVDAVRMLEQGFASKEDIDIGMMLGTSYPMGPLTLLDYVGLDTTLFIADVLFDEFKESRFAAPALLRQMVAAGWLGRKSGRGFSSYSAPASNLPAPADAGRRGACLGRVRTRKCAAARKAGRASAAGGGGERRRTGVAARLCRAAATSASWVSSPSCSATSASSWTLASPSPRHHCS